MRAVGWPIQFLGTCDLEWYKYMSCHSNQPPRIDLYYINRYVEAGSGSVVHSQGVRWPRVYFFMFHRQISCVSYGHIHRIS